MGILCGLRATGEVLLDTIVVRSQLLFALAYDLGEKLWWRRTQSEGLTAAARR